MAPRQDAPDTLLRGIMSVGSGGKNEDIWSLRHHPFFPQSPVIAMRLQAAGARIFVGVAENLRIFGLRRHHQFCPPIATVTNGL